MKDFTETLNFINHIDGATIFFKDTVIFWMIQIILLGIFLHAYIFSLYISYRNRSGVKGGVTFSIKRAEKSFEYFLYSASFGITAFLAVIFSISEAGKGYKISLFLLDSFIILYLCLWNNWFRNKIIGLVVKIKNKVEQ